MKSLRGFVSQATRNSVIWRRLRDKQRLAYWNIVVFSEEKQTTIHARILCVTSSCFPHTRWAQFYISLTVLVKVFIYTFNFWYYSIPNVKYKKYINNMQKFILISCFNCNLTKWDRKLYYNNIYIVTKPMTFSPIYHRMLSTMDILILMKCLKN